MQVSVHAKTLGLCLYDAVLGEGAAGTGTCTFYCIQLSRAEGISLFLIYYFISCLHFPIVMLALNPRLFLPGFAVHGCNQRLMVTWLYRQN